MWRKIEPLKQNSFKGLFTFTKEEDVADNVQKSSENAQKTDENQEIP